MAPHKTELNPGYFGPKMRLLTPKRRAFVIAMQELGGQGNGTNAGREGVRAQAARRAGYIGDQDALRNRAWLLVHDPEVIEAMKEFAFSSVAADVIDLTGVLSDIAHGVIPGTASEKLKAVAMIFNRIGLHEKTEHTMKVEHSLTNDQALQKINNFSKVLGLDPVKLLGRIGVQVVEDRIIDAEFTEVGEEDDPFAVPADEP